MIRITCFLLLVACLPACQNGEPLPDAYGNFEADEILVSSEANGRLLSFELEEGVSLAQGQKVGLVDTMQLHLQKAQLKARLRSLDQRLQDAEPDILVLQRQLDKLELEQRRFERLVAKQAATPQKLDDINGQIAVVKQQMDAAREKVSIANRAILSEADPIRAQIDLLEDQMEKCRVYSPISGRVLLKLAEPGEVVTLGKPLFKIAKLDPIFLRAYFSGKQLQSVKLDQELEVWVDDGTGGLRKLPGRVSWISDQAEFTPKTIQTREERVDLVYAVKIEVPNDGRLKVGMPAEARIKRDSDPATVHTN